MRSSELPRTDTQLALKNGGAVCHDILESSARDLVTDCDETANQQIIIKPEDNVTFADVVGRLESASRKCPK